MVSGTNLRGLIFWTRLSAAKMVEAHIGDDAVQPGVKAALKPETVQVAIDLQKGFLIHIVGIFGPLHEIER
jgi:hypothetical protein